MSSLDVAVGREHTGGESDCFVTPAKSGDLNIIFPERIFPNSDLGLGQPRKCISLKSLLKRFVFRLQFASLRTYTKSRRS